MKKIIIQKCFNILKKRGVNIEAIEIECNKRFISISSKEATNKAVHLFSYENNAGCYVVVGKEHIKQHDYIMNTENVIILDYTDEITDFLKSNESIIKTFIKLQKKYKAYYIKKYG